MISPTKMVRAYVRAVIGPKATIEVIQPMPDGIGWLVTYYIRPHYRGATYDVDLDRVYKTLLVTPEDLDLT